MDKIVRILSHSSVLVYQLVRGSGLADYTSSIYQFLGTQCDASSVLSRVLKSFSDLFTSGFQKEVVSQSLSQAFNSVRDAFDVILSSRFVALLKDLIASAISMKFFSKGFGHKFTRAFGKPKRCTISEFITKILDGLDMFFSCCDAFIRGESVSDILRGDDYLAKYNTEYRNLVAIFPHVQYYGVGETNCITFLNRVTELERSGEEIVKYIKRTDEKYSVFMTKQLECTRMRVTVEDQIKSRQRTPPASFILYGYPGIGKNMLASHIFSVWGEYMGREFSPNLIYTKTVGSEYWEGYSPSHQPYLKISELGFRSLQFAKTVVDKDLTDILGVCSADTKPLNMAFDGKGSTFARFECVVADTNNKDLHIKEQYYAPSAVFRRFNRIEVTVLPEYRLPGTTQVSKALVDLARREGKIRSFLDVYTFRVIRFQADGLKVKEDVLFDNAPIAQLDAFITECAAKYLKDTETEKQLALAACENHHAEMKVAGGLEVKSQSAVVPEVASGVAVWLYRFAVGSVVSGYVEADIKKAWPFSLFLASLCYFSDVLFPLLMILLFFLVIEVSRHGFFFKDSNRLKAYVSNKARDRIVSLPYVQYLLGLKEELPNMWNAHKYYYMAGAFLLAASAWKAYCVLFSKQKVSSQKAISDIETELAAKLPVERVKVKTRDKVWNVVKRDLPPALHKSPPEELYHSIAKNIYVFSYVHNGKAHLQYGLGLKSNFVLINSHFFPPGFQGGLVSLTYGDSKIQCHVPLSHIYRCGSDLCVFIFAKRNFKNIVHHFPENSDLPKHMVSYYMENRHVTKLTSGVRFKPDDGDPVSVDVALETNAPNSNGFCGYPICATVNSGSQIVGIHAGGLASEPRSYGIIVLKPVLESAIKSLETTTPFILASSQACVLNTEMPVPKSLFRYEYLPGIDYKGKLAGNININGKSGLVSLGVTPRLEEIFLDHFSHVRNTVFTKPLMKPIFKNGEYLSPWNYGMRKIGKIKPAVSLDDCAHVSEFLSNYLIASLRDKHVTIAPITLESALNGYFKDDYTRAMNLSTAGGHGFLGKKRDYVIETKVPVGEVSVKGNGTNYYTPTPYLQREVEKCFESYQKGELSLNFAQACLKDEPRDREKVAMGKTRIFYIDNFVKVLVGRMLLSPVYTLMHQYPNLFGTGIGFDMHRQADSIYRRMSKFDEGIAGDYSNYDQSMPEEICMVVNTVISKVCTALGYNEHASFALKGLLSDNMFPSVVMLQDLFIGYGLQISGKYGTAEDNSLRNIVLMQLAWHKLGLPLGDFYQNVVPLTYGDDIMATVSPKYIDRYNNHSYRDIMQELGMGFTSPDKNTELKRVYKLSEMSFLKREFVYWADRDAYVAPLDLDSLFKILEWRLPSQAVTEIEQVHQSTESLLREAYFHLRDEKKFESFSRDIRFLLHTKYGEIIDELSFSTFPEIDESIWGLSVSSQSLTIFVPGVCPVTHDTDELISFFFKERQRVLLYLEEQKTDLSIPMHEQPRHHKSALVYLDDCNKTISFIRESVETPRQFMNRIVSFQSSVADIGMSNAVSHSATDENVSDIFGYEEKQTGESSNDVDDQGQRNVLSNDDFFCRPIIIASFALLLDAPFNGSFDIWDLYTKDTRVRAKLKNWSYLRGDLHIRVSISGTPFHYGTVLLSYQPYPLRNATLQHHLSGVGNSSYRPLVMNYLSQAKGAVFMGIGENAPVEYTCPFISPKSSHKLFNESATVINSSDSYSDLADAGTLYFFTQNDPKSASSSPTNPHVVITAWMTDVTLGVPTATRIDVPSQSYVKDETKSGPVEKASSAIVRISDALSSIPAIAPFALATRHIFTGIGSLASHFGYSYPIMEEKNSRFRPNPFSNGAHGIGISTAKKISLDPKQELGKISPLFGYTDDELTIAYIASKWSLLTKFSWPYLSVYQDVLWRSKVTPLLCTGYEDLSGKWFQPTAMAYAAMPFAYWRGTIEFLFDFVVSKNHSGKVYIRFDPNIAQSALIGLSMTWNTNFVTIIDVQETRRISLSVDWASPRPWQLCNGEEDTMFGTGFDASGSESINGYIEVGVYNTLQSPVSDDIEVNVLTRCVDLQLVCPTEDNYPSDRVLPFQSFVTDVAESKLVSTSADSGNIALGQMGEQIFSYRTLLKRYSMESDITISSNALAGAKYYWRDQEIIPRPRPAYGEVNTDVTRPSVIGYLRYAYLGVRGSIRKRLRLFVEGEHPNTQRLTATILPPSMNATASGFTTGLAPCRMEGTVGELSNVNSNLEAEFPFYSPNYFVFSSSTDLIGVTPANELITEWFSHYRVTIDLYGNTDGGRILEESSTGEDFNFLMFLGAPFYRKPL